jgi:hypothetical protein
MFPLVWIQVQTMMVIQVSINYEFGVLEKRFCTISINHEVACTETTTKFFPFSWVNL